MSVLSALIEIFGDVLIHVLPIDRTVEYSADLVARRVAFPIIMAGFGAAVGFAVAAIIRFAATNPPPALPLCGGSIALGTIVGSLLAWLLQRIYGEDRP